MIGRTLRSTIVSKGSGYTLRMGGFAAFFYGVAYFSEERFNPAYELYTVVKGDLSTLKVAWTHNLSMAWDEYTNIFDGRNFVDGRRSILPVSYCLRPHRCDLPRAPNDDLEQGAASHKRCLDLVATAPHQAGRTRRPRRC